MGRMVRKQVYIEPEQDELLKRLSKELGVTEAALMRRALDSLTDEIRGDESLSGLISGVEITERELLSAFERHGIRRLDPLGEKFDHNFHQAMFHLEASDQPAGTVVEVVQAGYVIADRLLRPALVGVSKAADQGADDAPTHIDTEA